MYLPSGSEMLPAVRRGEQAPTLAELGDERLTVCVYRNGESSVLKDHWRSVSPQRLPLRGWVGTTTFVRRPDASTIVDGSEGIKGLKG
eukprot:11060313-Lingulodinium_polyedra.AAC.1